MMPFQIRVLIVDDHPVAGAGIRHTLASSSTVYVCEYARGVTDLQRALESGSYDALICDPFVWGDRRVDDASFWPEVLRRYPEMGVVVLTGLENAGVLHALLSQGLACFVSKFDELDHLAPAILSACARGRYLSPRMSAVADVIGHSKEGLNTLSARELEVLVLFLSGLSINEIARRLDRSKKTISTHKINATMKLGLARDIELLRYGLETGLVRV